MKYFKYILPILLVVGLIACFEGSCDSPTGPEEPPTDPTTTTTSVPNPPLIDPNTFPKVEKSGGQLWVDGELLKATTAFSLVPQGPGYATSFCQEMRMHDVNTARIFVEARNWTSAPSWLAQVAFDYDFEATKKTIESLGQAGCAVEVVISATVKEEPLQTNLQLIRRVAKDFKKYKHIVWSVMNEYKHHSSHPSVVDSSAAKEMLRSFNAVCPECLVSIDEHVNENTVKHRACSNTGLCDYFAWHVPRNDPKRESREFYRQVKRFGQPVFFDEMVCHATKQNVDDYGFKGKGTIALNGYGTELERWRHCNKVYNMAIAEGISPCWHSIDSMLCLIPPSEMQWPEEH